MSLSFCLFLLVMTHLIYTALWLLECPESVTMGRAFITPSPSSCLTSSLHYSVRQRNPIITKSLSLSFLFQASWLWCWVLMSSSRYSTPGTWPPISMILTVAERASRMAVGFSPGRVWPFFLFCVAISRVETVPAVVFLSCSTMACEDYSLYTATSSFLSGVAFSFFQGSDLVVPLLSFHSPLIRLSRFL